MSDPGSISLRYCLQHDIGSTTRSSRRFNFDRHNLEKTVDNIFIEIDRLNALSRQKPLLPRNDSRPDMNSSGSNLVRESIPDECPVPDNRDGDQEPSPDSKPLKGITA